MKRAHLFEFEDLQWFPSSIRNYGTDFLQYVSNRFDFYKGIAPIIIKGVEKSRTHQIIDLASGGGGGWKKLAQHLKTEIPDLTITLTDFYPNIEAFKKTVQAHPDVFSFREESVNALDVPKELKGLRTQFLSFHHFKPANAKRILQNAVDNGVPIALFEAQERDFQHLIKNMFSPLSVLLTTPFIRPFKLGRIIFTYFIPIVPLFVLWDGVISVLRTYTVEELKEMTKMLAHSHTYVWEVGKHKNGPITILYLLGYKKDE
jgi:hypothetical protein